MVAIQTFWSDKTTLRAAGELNGGWLDARFHLMSWALSVSLLKKHFSKVILCTDTFGKKLLVDTLQLPYDEVILSQTGLELKYPREVWVMRKINSYQQLEEPFVHIDSDAFLWKPLPDTFYNSTIFAQNYQKDFSCYDIARKELADIGIQMPSILASETTHNAVNMGIIGGQDKALFKEYYQFLESFVGLHLPKIQANKTQLSLGFVNTLLEECFFVHFVELYYNKPIHVLIEDKLDSRYTKIANLLDKKYGYHHLIGENKLDLFYCKQVEQALKFHFPAVYKHITAFISEFFIKVPQKRDYYAESNYRIQQKGSNEVVTPKNVKTMLQTWANDETLSHAIVFEHQRNKDFRKVKNKLAGFQESEQARIQFLYEYLEKLPIGQRLNDTISYDSSMRVSERIWDDGKSIFSSLIYDFGYGQAHYDDKIWDTFAMFILYNCSEEPQPLEHLLALLQQKTNQQPDELLQRFDIKIKELYMAGLLHYTHNEVPASWADIAEAIQGY